MADIITCFKKSFELTEYKENQIVVQSIYSNINENINRITYEQENIKKIRHDLKNHLVIIKSMDKDEHLSQYLDQLYSKIDNVKIGHEVITGNVYVDTIINSKISEYCNVSLTYDCSIDGLKLKPIDLSMLLFNLLDNACHSASEVNGFVDLKMNYIGNHLFIEVKNDFKEKPNFISKKGVGHGYGMRIINDIVEEYYGEIEYKVLENEVNVKVGLNIED